MGSSAPLGNQTRLSTVTPTMMTPSTPAKDTAMPRQPLGPRRTIAGAGLALALLISACGSDAASIIATEPIENQDGSTAEIDNTIDQPGDTPVDVDLPVEPGNNADPIDVESSLNDDWHLTTISIEGGIETTLPIPFGRLNPTLNLEGTTISGQDGCTEYSANVTYDIPDGSFADDGTFAVDAIVGPFVVHDIVATNPDCIDDEISKLFNQALQSTTIFTMEPGSFMLSNGADQPTIMNFGPPALPPNPPSLPEVDRIAADDDLAMPDQDNEQVLDDPANAPRAPSEDYVGLTLEAAEVKAETDGHTLRLASLEGEPLGGTADVDNTRVNLTITDGIVTAAHTG